MIVMSLHSTILIQLQLFQEVKLFHTQTQLPPPIGISPMFKLMLKSLMQMILLPEPDKWPLKCKLKWMLQSPLLTKRELNNKSNTRTTWAKTIQLLNFKA
jgi:hypothetical protein